MVGAERHYPKQILAEVSAKNRLHGIGNSYSMLGKKGIFGMKPGQEMNLENLAESTKNAPLMFADTTVAMSAPVGNGAAAIVICSER
jgi:hypothetical protein